MMRNLVVLILLALLSADLAIAVLVQYYPQDAYYAFETYVIPLTSAFPPPISIFLLSNAVGLLIVSAFMLGLTLGYFLIRLAVGWMKNIVYEGEQGHERD